MRSTAIIVPMPLIREPKPSPRGIPLAPGTVVPNSAFALFNAPLWHLALIASRLHLVWIGTVLRETKDRLPLLEHARLEHFPGADSHHEEPGGSDSLR